MNLNSTFIDIAFSGFILYLHSYHIFWAFFLHGHTIFPLLKDDS